MAATMPKPRIGRTKSGRKPTTRGAIGKTPKPTNVQVAEAALLAAKSNSDTWGLHRVKGAWELTSPHEVVPGDRLVGRDGWQIQV
jgi:hypothetical protein